MYPSDSDITSWASTNASDPEPTYAFTTAMGRLPLSGSELTGWWASTLSNPAFAGITDPNLIAAYIINNRGLPPSPAIAIAWLQNFGYFANGQPTGQEPQVGQGYDQAVGLVNTAPTAGNPVTGAAPTGVAAPGPFDSVTSLISEHPIISAVVGLGVAYGAFKLVGGGRR